VCACERERTRESEFVRERVEVCSCHASAESVKRVSNASPTSGDTPNVPDLGFRI